MSTHSSPWRWGSLLICLILLLTPDVSGQCGICIDGVAMSNPNSSIPLFGNETVGKTCQEKDNDLSQVAAEDCFDIKLDWKVDLASYCGCEGAELDTNLPADVGCLICMDGETFEENIFDISGGYPLINFPLSCQYVSEVAPFLKYISGCEDFQEWYGTGVCCYQQEASPSPTPAPTSATISSVQSSMMKLFALMVVATFTLVI